MTKSEYHELVDFLGVQFTEVGRRFDAVETRLESVENRLESVENRLTRVEVFAEENRHLIQIVADGVTTVDRKVDALAAEMNRRFDEQNRMFRLAHEDHEQRIIRLERP